MKPAKLPVNLKTVFLSTTESTRAKRWAKRKGEERLPLEDLSHRLVRSQRRADARYWRAALYYFQRQPRVLELSIWFYYRSHSRNFPKSISCYSRLLWRAPYAAADSWISCGIWRREVQFALQGCAYQHTTFYKLRFQTKAATRLRVPQVASIVGALGCTVWHAMGAVEETTIATACESSAVDIIDKSKCLSELSSRLWVLREHSSSQCKTTETMTTWGKKGYHSNYIHEENMEQYYITVIHSWIGWL